MHNYFHAVLFIDKSTTDDWDSLEVVERRHLLFNSTLYSRRFRKDVLLTGAGQVTLNRSITLYGYQLVYENH
jgi:hypothetical protein